jgi:hypothetical protein
MALYLDDKKVGGIKELLTALKLDEKEIPYRKRVKEFQQIMERDIHGNARMKDGRNMTTRNITGRPEYTVYVPKLGYEVRIRIAQTQRKDKDEGFIYTPNIISMIPGEDGIATITDDLEFAFWYLHPWCAHSPFYKTESQPFFEYKDDDAKSKMDNDNEENRINALSYIVGYNSKPIKQLRSLAKGFNIGGVDDMTDEVVKKQLRILANNDPVGFVNKIESRELVFSGEIQDAIDKGVLTLGSLNGMNRWYLSGKEILPISYGQDALAVLKDELSTKWYLYAKDIEAGLAKTEIASNLQNPAQDEVFEKHEVYKVEQRAELTPEQLVILKEMEADTAYMEKIKALAALDPTDPALHHSKLKSYNTNIAAIQAYKAASLVPAEESVEA